jgi:hypothetical protein
MQPEPFSCAISVTLDQRYHKGSFKWLKSVDDLCAVESTEEERDFYARVQSSPRFYYGFRVHPEAQQISFLLALRFQQNGGTT